MSKGKKIALVLGSLRTGGAERALVNLANGMESRGMVVDLVVVEKAGEFLPMLHARVRLRDLGRKRARYAFFAFRKYLRDHSPEVLVVAQVHVQLLVIAAVIFSPWKGKLILNEQSTFSANTKRGFYRFLVSIFFRRADALTFVSEGSAADFRTMFPSLKKKTSVIANPVFTEEILRLKEEPVSHPYLDGKKYPVILWAGRLSREKDLPLLLRAFSLVLEEKQVRLIVLGTGEEQESLQEEIARLKIQLAVSLPGNVMNPYAYMSRCDLFVLTSIYEGLPSVLIEALACGCAIVSMDCPHGPAEILDNGKFGTLVTDRDPRIFAKAILRHLSNEQREEQKLARAREYSLDNITSKYLALIDRLQ
jgi:glycosyltransferase involved in cell wall biosynthesis